MMASLAEDADFVITADIKPLAATRGAFPRLVVDQDDGGEGRSPNRVDLRPLLKHKDAPALLSLARGQLNRAFRKHGLFPPDPLRLVDLSGIDFAYLDDPAAVGIDNAHVRFGAAFGLWMGEMPVKLVLPVLEILEQTREALRARPGAENAATRAAQTACDFLRASLEAR